jgi:lambda repressor-like predicted transcriptional regulator
VSLSKEYGVSSRSIARVVYNVDWYDENYVPPIPRKINNNGKPKLTWEKVNQIRQMRQRGVSLAELSNLFGVTQANISTITTGKTWRGNE